MKIIFCSIIVILLFSSCNNDEQKTPAVRVENDSSDISPSIGGPVAEIKTSIRRSDTVPSGRKNILLRDVQAQYLDSSTKIGKANDLLLTFTGQGFIFTEHNPAVIIGDTRYDNSFSNEEGTELYVIIPQAVTGKFAASLRDSIRVVNPGRNKETAALVQDGKEIMSKASKASKTALLFTTYGVTRRKPG